MERCWPAGSRDGTAILWSTQTWEAEHTLRNPDQRHVEAVSFSPDCKSLAMASFGGNLHLWDVASGKLLRTLKGHFSEVKAVAFSPEGRTLATAGADQTVRIWNVESGRELIQMQPGGVDLGTVNSLRFSPDGTQLLAAGQTIAFSVHAATAWDDPGPSAEKLAGCCGCPTPTSPLASGC